MAGIRLDYTAAEINTSLGRAEEGGAIDQELETKQDELTFDATPQANSTNPVESGGIADADDTLESMVLAAFQTGSASGSVASFTDGADGVALKSATFSIEPTQDLNGYNYPWPAGGGKNKLPMTLANIKALNTAGTWSDNDYSYSGITFTVITDDGGNVERIDAKGTATVFVGLQLCGSTSFGAQDVTLNGCPTGGSSTTYDIAAFDDSVSPVANKGNDYGGNGVAFTAESGHTYYVRIAIRNGYAISGTISFYPMIRLSTEADATFAPYSNICPISGWTSANICRTDGDNLLSGKTWTNGSYYGNDGSIIAGGSTKRMNAYIPVTAGQPYMLSCANNPTIRIRVHEYDSNQNWLRQIYSNTGEVAKWTASDDAAYIRMSLGNAATDIVCYLGNIYNIDWTDEAGTVYGGTLEYKGGGAWRLTAGKVAADIGDSDWNYNETNAFFYHTFADKAANTPFLASCYATGGTRSNAGMATADNNTVYFAVDSGVAKIKDTAYTDAAVFKAARAGQFLVYDLATPTTYDLTTEQVITTLKGSNAIWSDAGNSTVEYAIDPTFAKPSYPLVTAAIWNTCMRDGSVTPAITLPEIGTPTSTQEFQYVFTAASTNASFTAPAGVMLTDGATTTAAGGTLSYSNLTANSVYECNFAVITTTLIALVMKEW